MSTRSIYGWSPAVVTSTPLAFGSSICRDKATGPGMLYAAERLFDDHGAEMREFSYAIREFGHVASNAARLLHEVGSRIIALSSLKYTQDNATRIDMPMLLEHVRAHHAFNLLPRGQLYGCAALLSSFCDVLVPAALGGVVNKKTTGGVRARFAVEDANHSTDPDADFEPILNGVICPPSIYPDSGDLMVNYFELVQDRKSMCGSCEPIAGTALRHSPDPPTAPFAVAAARVSRATPGRGL